MHLGELLQNPAFRSLARKAITVGTAYVSAKLGCSPEELAGIVGTVAAALQVQSSLDDKKIARSSAERARDQVVAEISETIKLPTTPAAASGPAGYTAPPSDAADQAPASRVGPTGVGDPARRTIV